MSKIKRILLLAANPHDTTRLYLNDEIREIDEGLRRSKTRDHFVIEQRWAVSLKDLRLVGLQSEHRSFLRTRR